MRGDDLSWRFVLRSQRLLHLNARDFARLAGVSHQAVRCWRSGLYMPRSDAVLRVVKELKRQGLLDDVLG